MQLVNEPSWIGPHEVFQLWLSNTVYHSLISEEYKGEGELIWGGGGKRGFMVFKFMFIWWMCFHYIISVWDKGAHLVTVAYFEKQTWKKCLLLCDK